MRPARRSDADLYVVAEGGEKFHETLGRKGTGSSTHQVGDVRLRNAEDLAGLGLCQLACLENPVNLKRQAGLEQLLFGIWQAEIGEHVAGAFLDFNLGPLLRHVSSAFPCNAVQRLPIGGGPGQSRAEAWRFPSSISSGTREAHRPRSRTSPYRRSDTCRRHPARRFRARG